MRITVTNTYSQISELPSTELNKLAKALTVKVPNYYFSAAYKSGRWDGTMSFFQRPENMFATGLLPVVEEFFKDYEIPIIIDDYRKNQDYKIPFVEENFKLGAEKILRDYQVSTLNAIADRKIFGIPFYRGIVNIATNGGKTVIAEGLMKLLLPELYARNQIFLFVTNSKEIAYQTKRSIERELNIEVGVIGDGKWSVEPITIALPTTLYKRMQGKRKEFKELKEQVAGFVADECLSGDTPILLANGKTMSIRGICEKKLTDVMSYNLEKQRYEKKKILRRIVTPATERFYKIEIGIDYETRILKATGNHKIYTVNRGYVQVEDLTIYDTLKLYEPNNARGKFAKIISVERVGGVVPEYKYNLEVEGNHNYFANGILVSNCHHSSADSSYKVFSELDSAYIRIGLTGTVDKSNPVNELKVYSGLAPVITKISNDYLIKRGVSAKPTCIMFHITQPEVSELEYVDAYDIGIVQNDFRNEVIRAICKKETDSNHTVLILVERLEHGANIAETLKDLNRKVYYTNGQLNSSDREELLEKLRNHDLDVLIASNILDEGVDVSGINAVIYARGMKSIRKLLQGIGRGLRAKEDNVLRFYDFIDDTHKNLLLHSKDRYEVLADEQFSVKLMTVKDYEKATWEEITTK